jgi:hypothetical protein
MQVASSAGVLIFLKLCDVIQPISKL